MPAAIVCLIAPDAKETPEYRYIKHVTVLYYIEVRGKKRGGKFQPLKMRELSAIKRNSGSQTLTSKRRVVE